MIVSSGYLENPSTIRSYDITGKVIFTCITIMLWILSYFPWSWCRIEKKNAASDRDKSTVYDEAEEAYNLSHISQSTLYNRNYSERCKMRAKEENESDDTWLTGSLFVMWLSSLMMSIQGKEEPKFSGIFLVLLGWMTYRSFVSPGPFIVRNCLVVTEIMNLQVSGWNVQC